MYLNLTQISQSFGVSERVVEDWMRNEGLPHTLDRGRVLFDRAQVAPWAAARGLAAQAGFLAPANPTMSTEGRLAALVRTGGIWRNVAPGSVPEVFARIVEALPGATPAMRQLILQRLRAKGGVTMAPVGGGFALPHPTMRVALGRASGVVAILLLGEALALAEPLADDVPVTRLIFFVAPSPRAHLDLLGQLTRNLARGPLRELLVRDASDEELYQALATADAPTPSAVHRGAQA
jgi:PTS system nitrogen regulatory IIA component